MKAVRIVSLFALGAMILAACTTTQQVTVNVPRENAVFGIRQTATTSLRNDVAKLPPIRGKARPIEGPRPSGIKVDSIGIEDSEIIGVGVAANGSFDVPTHHEVGWYKYGPSPGEFGSAVLAAHVVLNGTDGVFRHLADAQEGDEVTVSFDDGSEQHFRIVGLSQYAKSELPLDEIFRRDGEPQLVLITCGGDYDPITNGYLDNIVAFAAPA